MPKFHQRWTVFPNGPLRVIDDGILTVAGDIPMPLGNFPRRMTVVRLSGGRSAIYSAVALCDADMARIEEFGRPAVLIVPSGAHRLDARIWKQRYPDLRVLTPPGARELVEQVVAVDAMTDILDDHETQFVVVDGTAGRESALIVRRPGGTTIICNDVIGNVRHPRGIGAHIMVRLTGFGVSRPRVPRLIRRFIVADSAALARQFREWASLPGLRRIIVSHGEPIETAPQAALLALAASLAA